MITALAYVGGDGRSLFTAGEYLVWRGRTYLIVAVIRPVREDASGVLDKDGSKSNRLCLVEAVPQSPSDVAAREPA